MASRPRYHTLNRENNAYYAKETALFMQEKLHLSKKVEKRGCHNVHYPVIYFLACGAHDSELRSGTPAGKPKGQQQRVNEDSKLCEGLKRIHPGPCKGLTRFLS